MRSEQILVQFREDWDGVRNGGVISMLGPTQTFQTRNDKIVYSYSQRQRSPESKPVHSVIIFGAQIGPPASNKNGRPTIPVRKLSEKERRHCERLLRQEVGSRLKIRHWK